VINVALLRRTLQWVQEHPEHWNQRRWAVESRCGTAFCFAGAALFLTEAQFTFGDAVNTGTGASYADFVLMSSLPPDVQEGCDSVGSSAAEEDDRVWISEAARELLGLSYEQANDLFDAYNSLGDLEDIVGKLVDSAS
jgi:hypothetical protein